MAFKKFGLVASFVTGTVSAALAAGPAAASAQVDGQRGDINTLRLPQQIQTIDDSPLPRSKDKPVTIRGSDGRPIVIGPASEPRQQLPKFPDLLPLPDSSDDTASELFVQNWRKRLDLYSIPIGPGRASNELVAEADKRASGLVCRGSESYDCRFVSALRGSAGRLAGAAAAAPECERAAVRFGEHYRQLLVPTDIARDFDIACLGSFAPRLADAGSVRPEVLKNAEADGMLDVVGLLEVNGAIICAGLLRPDRKFVTARHCIEGSAGVPLKVRLASNRLPAMNVQVRRHPSWSELGVPADWAVLDLEPGPALPIPTSRLTSLTLPTKVSLIGTYRYAQPDVYAPGSVSFERDLRFPRDGFCEAIDELSGCLQLACQTVRGFSGAPIITSRGSDGSIEVIGFLSHSEGDAAACRKGVMVSNSTFAVSATQIQGI